MERTDAGLQWPAGSPSVAMASAATLSLDMSHVGLGTLDEFSLLVLFGNAHSRYLTEGLPHDADRIVDAKGNPLYPAYFMTHLRVPPSCSLKSFPLWSRIHIETEVKRYGDTILDSTYRARGGKETAPCIEMQANSLFILDPSVFRTPTKQVSVPREGAVRTMAKLGAPPPAVQESARVRARGFEGSTELRRRATPYRYTPEFGRDTAPGHPLMFAKIPQIMDLSEREFLRELTGGRISEEMLQATALLERKTFYYGNAFAGDRLTLHTKGTIEPCSESLWKDNPQMHYVCRITYETEMYKDGELLALARAQKAIVHEIRHQSMIQDTKRVFAEHFVKPEITQGSNP